MRLPRLRIRGKLIALFLALGLVPMAVVGYQTYREASNDLEEDAGARMSAQALNLSDVLDRNLFERYGDVQAFAKSDPARSMDPERLTAWMDTLMPTYTPIYKLMVVAERAGGSSPPTRSIPTASRSTPSS